MAPIETQCRRRAINLLGFVGRKLAARTETWPVEGNIGEF